MPKKSVTEEGNRTGSEQGEAVAQLAKLSRAGTAASVVCLSEVAEEAERLF